MTGTGMEETNDSPANQLCKSCGLCCTGHLFIWTKLRSAELDSIEALGLKVIRSVPSQRGFSQPCALWQGHCTIYTATSYPRFCQTYKCALLKKLLDGTTALPEALSQVEQAKEMVHELEALLPESHSPNFRERLVTHIEALDGLKESPGQEQAEFRQKAEALLAVYAEVFGVDDLIE
ncbi:MAG TPA: hypothetical protein VFY66_04275 [Anaerolineales bacterium]|nr:hypothetical protein [Anaerolineales bacterium]